MTKLSCRVSLCFVLLFCCDVECRYAESRCAKYHYAECRYPECCDAECRGALILGSLSLSFGFSLPLSLLLLSHCLFRATSSLSVSLQSLFNCLFFSISASFSTTFTPCSKLKDFFLHHRSMLASFSDESNIC